MPWYSVAIFVMVVIVLLTILSWARWGLRGPIKNKWVALALGLLIPILFILVLFVFEW